ncbi:NADH-quinone oxidoreductase subunit C [Candidatus Viridilinea mediisalina]|uniref:NADH-quinone oxidoreductase subunit C n=1 Tax=Candidatus Viridilinea mediisalina TaxID=2024553 RepID=A0A2A6RII2_9CHLR|nr:NADH-quinone oxidoreductase subunit C [Candidatus Viridilinea mediisalina]PDW02706.1 NADH-quinone oxidoreductase subunit C [Candidatus Viridilinea mediisalina]
MDNQTLLKHLRDRFGDAILATDEAHGELRVNLRREAYVAVAQWLRDDPALRYTFLENLCAVDYLGRTPRFEVVVHLVSMQHIHRVCLKLGLPEADPTLDSLTPIFPTANYQEREAFDLMGIRFTGHPSLTRILLPDDWVGHPQRKDHPLVEEEIAFTFNQDRIYAQKPFAKE